MAYVCTNSALSLLLMTVCFVQVGVWLTAAKVVRHISISFPSERYTEAIYILGVKIVTLTTTTIYAPWCGVCELSSECTSPTIRCKRAVVDVPMDMEAQSGEAGRAHSPAQPARCIPLWGFA